MVCEDMNSFKYIMELHFLSFRCQNGNLVYWLPSLAIEPQVICSLLGHQGSSLIQCSGSAPGDQDKTSLSISTWLHQKSINSTAS